MEAGKGQGGEKTEVIIVQQEPASGFKGNGGPLLAYMQLDLAELNANLLMVLLACLQICCFLAVEV